MIWARNSFWPFEKSDITLLLTIALIICNESFGLKIINFKFDHFKMYQRILDILSNMKGTFEIFINSKGIQLLPQLEDQ